ncbi:MAG: hypothetical protein M1833_003979 [Piccolia ochrophora]|nr:MAG: hypothetical protein M1833_003979 [Piccolia ochrophora]
MTISHHSPSQGESTLEHGAQEQPSNSKCNDSEHGEISPPTSARPECDVSSPSGGDDGSSPRDVEKDPDTPAEGPLYSVFSKRQKGFIVFMAAAGGFFSPLSANIYFPALPTLASAVHVSDGLINLTLTSYMIFQGLAPTIFGDLADIGGRRPAYILGFIIYMAANIGLAVQSSYVALLLLRCLQSTGSSATIALANGVVADISTSSERGSYIGLVQSGALLGPVFGPIIGGVLAEFLGWRSIFWFLLILAAIYIVPYVIFCPETGRNIVDNGSIPPQGWNMSLLNYRQARKLDQNQLNKTQSREDAKRAQAELARTRSLRWPNPLRTIHVIFEKDVGLVLLYSSIIYTAFYTIIVSLPSQFKQIYNFNELQLGLCFIPFGAGCCLASILVGKLMDRNYKRIADLRGFTIDRKRGDDLRHFPIEQARIQVIWPLLLVGVATTISYGWVLFKETTLAVPLILHFVLGITLTGSFNALSTLLVDLYPLSPATVTAANNLVRCLMGAGGTAVIDLMINAMGRGWCFVFVGLVLGSLSPLLLVEVAFGPKWREERRLRTESQSDQAEESAPS